MNDFWNERYSQEAYAYGETPNEYLKSKLASISTGKILFPAEGEGRNAVYAATLGWDVVAFDSSKEGKKKALSLAQKQAVSIDYLVEEISNIEFEDESFDAIALVFVHTPQLHRAAYHQKIASFLKSGGILILEGFSKAHARFQHENPLAGGPKDSAMLFDIEELKQDFSNFDIVEAHQTETNLHEGLYHQGKASVVRLFIIKK
jgi:ubiquinone/menaquinone biosynthesis C-methylase UbiE